MAILGKIFGGGIGWALGGPIGGILGAILGHAIDSARVEFTPGTGQRVRTQTGDFNMSLLILSAAVMKADGKVMKSELKFVKDFYARQFHDPEAVREQMQVLKKVLEQEIPLMEVCNQIRVNMRPEFRLELIHYLFGISMADGHVHKTEADLIQTISGYLGIPEKDYVSIRAMFYKDAGAAYKILEIPENASNDEIKKAYRRMALKYHPDKVSSLGADYEKHAKEKFQKVQEAYETLKKERNLA